VTIEDLSKRKTKQRRSSKVTSWVVQARGPANVRSLPFNLSFRMAINVKRAIS